MFVKKILRPTIAVQQIQYIPIRGNGSGGDDGDSGRAGAIGDAGGAFAKRGKAKENEYFYKMQREQLKKLKDQIKGEIDFHEEQIKRHQEAIDRNKSRVEDIDIDNDK